MMGATSVPGAPTSGTFLTDDVTLDPEGVVWAAGQLYPVTILNDDPLIYYRANDAGANLVDRLGGYTAAFSGTVTKQIAGVTTDGDTAAAFGSNGYARAVVPLAIPGDFTLECWIKKAAPSSGFPAAIYIGDPTTFGTNVNTLSLSLGDSSGNAAITCRINGTFMSRGTAAQVADGNWHHVVVTRIGITTQCYVDGAAFGTSVTNMTTGVIATEIDIAAVNNAGTAQRFESATLDELAIYNKGLTAAQVTAHYNAALSASPWLFVGTASPVKVQTWAARQAFSQPVDLTKITTPSAPVAGVNRLWADSVSGALSFMSSSGQALQVASGMIATPRTYGGVGDGGADDTTPLNNAYAGAGEGNKNMLYIPGGSWKYTSQLAWNPGNKDILILGAGIQVTELKPSAFGGSSLVLSSHTASATEIGHIGISGPGIYANPTTNPGNTAGVDGLEFSSGIIGSWVRIQNCGTGMLISNTGGHKRLFHSNINNNYYNIYLKGTGGDDFFVDVQNVTAMFAAFYTDDWDTTEDLGFSLGVIRVHCNAQPFVFYQGALTTKTLFSSDIFAHHFSLEQVCNGFAYAASFATKGNTYGWHFVDCGTMSGNTNYRRSDSPSDYMVVIGQSNGPCFFWGWPATTQDKGFMFSQNNLGSPWHFYGASGYGAIFNMNGGDGNAVKWHSGLSGTSSFPAASGNNATKTIGANGWCGPPASQGLLLYPTTDGGLTNSFNLIPGAIQSCPRLQTPAAPAPALITSAGNIDAGNHAYAFIFRTTSLNGRAGNSTPSATTASVTNDASHAQNTVNLPANGITPTGAPTVTIEWYRNKVADQTHFFQGGVGIALGTVSITDNLADASLGAAMPTVGDDFGWQSVVTLKTTTGQTGNPSIAYAMSQQ